MTDISKTTAHKNSTVHYQTRLSLCPRDPFQRIFHELGLGKLYTPHPNVNIPNPIGTFDGVSTTKHSPIGINFSTYRALIFAGRASKERQRLLNIISGKKGYSELGFSLIPPNSSPWRIVILGILHCILFSHLEPLTLCNSTTAAPHKVPRQINACNYYNALVHHHNPLLSSRSTMLDASSRLEQLMFCVRSWSDSTAAREFCGHSDPLFITGS